MTAPGTSVRGRPSCAPGSPDPVIRRHPFRAVNLISDPIHGYIELTKRLAPAESRAAGLPDEEAAEEDLLDTAWLQRLRRISQLQSARWVFPTAEHSRFTHGLGVMHEAGLWARQLYPSLRRRLQAAAAPAPSEGLVVETLRIAGPAPRRRPRPVRPLLRRPRAGRLRCPGRPAAGRRQAPHPRGPLAADHRGRAGADASVACVARRAPIRSATPSRTTNGSIRPGSPILVSKPALDDPAMPRWVRWLQPLLSGVFTVDNLDYVRRDAYLTGVAIGPVDVERLRRYAFISERGLTLYEPGLAALEMFLTARLFMYQQVYFHRTVRAIDLDLAEVFGTSIRAIFGDGSPADDSRAYADLDEYALLHQAARWVRGEDVAAESDRPATPGDRPGRPARRRDLARDPAPPAALARRGRDPRGVRGRRPRPTDAHRDAGGGRAGPRRHRPRHRRRAPGRRRSPARRRDWPSRCATGRRVRRWPRRSGGCPAMP